MYERNIIILTSKVFAESPEGETINDQIKSTLRKKDIYTTRWDEGLFQVNDVRSSISTFMRNVYMGNKCSVCTNSKLKVVC